MNKKVVLAIILVIALSILSGSVLAIERPLQFEKSQDVVAWLYRDFGWEALISQYFDKDSLVE